MEYSPRFRLLPTEEQRETLDWTRNTVRQVYNHGLYRFNQLDESNGTVKQRVTQIRDELPELKQDWTDLQDVYSKVLQTHIERIARNISNLGKLKKKGYNVGSLNWKKPRDFRSFTYNQSGFKLDHKSGPNGRGVLYLSKIGWVPIRLHRDILEDAKISEVTVKKEPTGAWYASFCIEVEEPEKPPVKSLSVDDCVGIDLGVLNFVHDSNGIVVDRLDLSDDRERLEREQRALSRKEYESNNWGKQRQRVAKVHSRMSEKKWDFKNKIAHYYTAENSAVFLEDLKIKRMLESPQNARKKAESGWRDLITIFKHHGRKNGCYVVTVKPENTTLDCASCGKSVYKPLWVREHSCPTCGFELDRDWNAALNVLNRGLSKIGVVHSEETPVETATAVSTDGGEYSSMVVDASRVTEAGSTALKEATRSVAE
ncbi:RNA-guided endonuclease InsQ/TnpB family protein [Haloarcula onubensis]|uniref:Transposase n=1 Tax=Haloarcula onubensis TaxID=2950539 RepID=A0ABU2FU90_9EURY|nr:transposase [Halomicroarcula sp. S3CR25-11]MDS0283837.1 transposase [Halomicroarcula sp. S3CR25-11]